MGFLFRLSQQLSADEGGGDLGSQYGRRGGIPTDQPLIDTTAGRDIRGPLSGLLANFAGEEMRQERAKMMETMRSILDQLVQLKTTSIPVKKDDDDGRLSGSIMEIHQLLQRSYCVLIHFITGQRRGKGKSQVNVS